jgi:protein-disulfide isomerase
MNIQTRFATTRNIPLITIALTLATTLGTDPAAAQSKSGIDKLNTEVEALKQGQDAMQRDITEIRKMLEDILERARPKPFQPLDISLASAPSRGDRDAPVTLIEFTDFQCPYCGRYFSNTLPEVIKQYVDTGKVRYVIREMPLASIHPYAEKAAEAALCAGAQNKYWEMHDALFKDQSHLKPEDLPARAAKVGLDLPQFSQCLESGMKAGETQQDVKYGSQAGVSGTPTFFLGLTNPKAPDTLHATQMIRGAQPFAAFKQTIDALLATARISTGAGS